MGSGGTPSDARVVGEIATEEGLLPGAVKVGILGTLAPQH